MGLPPVHPGAILADEMAEIGLPANRMARALGVATNRISEIVAGRRAVSADTALRLGRYFGTSARFWLDLKADYDLDIALARKGKAIDKQVRQRQAA
ncbi:MAG: HigA family addiction module antidote protein [Rhodospirillales bacterium]|nr:HigA family addiction module antidote protein [Rhodospirillales bacterium]